MFSTRPQTPLKNVMKAYKLTRNVYMYSIYIGNQKKQLPIQASPWNEHLKQRRPALFNEVKC